MQPKIRTGTPVSYLTAQGRKVFGVVIGPSDRNPRAFRVQLAGNLVITMSADFLKVER